MVNLIIFIGVIILLIIIMLAEGSKKETKREKIAEATANLTCYTAGKFSGLVESVLEPADKKKLRLAREALAMRNRLLYRFKYYSDKDSLNRLLTVDDSFKESLDIIGLSEDRWKKIGLHLFYVGVIRDLSRERNDYSKKNSEYSRQYIIDTYGDDSFLKDYVNTLKEALSYFHISEKEWIKYGDAVVEMYNLNDNKDIEEYGNII